MIKITELGTFYGKFSKDFRELLSPTAFDWSGRKLFLKQIQQVKYKEIGSSNYSYDQIGTYNFIFHINSGDNEKSWNADENYYYILQVEVAEWYRPENMLAEEFKEKLKEYPILFIQELLDAFKQRHYFDERFKINTLNNE